MASDNELKNFHDSVTSFMETGGTGGGLASLPPATTTELGGVIVGGGLSVSAGTVSLQAATTKQIGGIKPGTGLKMEGDTLNCTITGGAVLSSVESSLNGAMWYVV